MKPGRNPVAPSAPPALTLIAALAILGAVAPRAQGEPSDLLLDTRLPVVRLFDTGAPLSAPLAARPAVAAWASVAEGATDYAFRGDAVVANDRVALAVRRGAPEVELYAKRADGLRLRARLAPAAGDGGAEIVSLRVVEAGPSAVSLDVGFLTGAGETLVTNWRLTTGDTKVQVTFRQQDGRLAVRADLRYVVVPDFFADDMVFAPGVFRADRVGLPAENFFLGLAGESDCILVSVWESSGRDVDVIFAERDGKRAIERYELDCPAGAKAWVALLEAPGIWHTHAAEPGDARAETQRDWTPPFPAKWRADLVADGPAAQSSDFLEGPGEAASGGQGPCVSCLAGVRVEAGAPGGEPAQRLIVYPIDRSRATPLNAFCPIDVIRSALGVGPCQYILAMEGLDLEAHPTPADVTHWIERQFKRKRDGRQAETIRQRLGQMVEHVARTQKRIERYAAFAEEVRRLCAEPGGDAVARLRRTAEEMKRGIAGRRGEAGSPERVRELADKMAALIGTPDALAECERLGEEIRAIGHEQDYLLARSRMAARWIREQCRTAPDERAGAADLIAEVRRLAEEMLASR